MDGNSPNRVARLGLGKEGSIAMQGVDIHDEASILLYTKGCLGCHVY